jgi:hypothetical protein
LKLKLDENLALVAERLLCGAGHDVHTIFHQRLVGTEGAAFLSAATPGRASWRPRM